MYYSSGGDRDGRGEDDYDRSRRFKQLRRESSRSYIDQHTSGRDYLSSSSSSATSASLQADRYSDRRATAPKSSAEERGYVEGRRNDYTSTSRRDGERERERERERDKEYDSRDRPRNGTGTRDYRDDESSWQRNSRDGRDSRRDLQREYGSYGEEERRSDRGRLARDSYSSRDLRGDLRSSRDERASDRSTYRSRDRDRDRDRDRERDSLRDRGRDRDRPRDRTDRYERGYDDAGRHNQSYSRRDDGYRRERSHGRRRETYRARDRYGRYDSRYDYYGERRYRQRSRTPSPCRRHGREDAYKRKGSPSASPGRSVSSSPASRSGSSPARSNSLDDREGHIKITPGQTITPRYTVREVLGEGTFGKVLDCWDRKLEKNVALKVVRAVDKYKDAAMIEIDILEKLQKYGCEGKDMCISLLDWFEYRNHIVMSFDRFGLSLYDFIKQNHYQGFSIEIVEEMGYQLLKAIAFMHDLTLIHTDLKPENILLVNSQSEEVPISPDEALRRSRSRSRSSSRSRSPGATERIKRVPINSAIKVIDFGSATFDSHHHTRVISTRHYRAPEVILGLGWTYPADIWSVGCILAELLSGDALFVTHDNVEHLAMMERVFGPIPERMAANADRRKAQKFFKGTKLRWPELARERVKHGTRYVDKMCPLADTLPGQYPDFCDLLERLLEYEPEKRMNARDALQHHFFDRARAKYGDMGERPDPFVIESIVASDSENEESEESEEEERGSEDGERRSRDGRGRRGRSGGDSKKKKRSKSKSRKKETTKSKTTKSGERSGKRGGSGREEKDKRRKGKERS